MDLELKVKKEKINKYILKKLHNEENPNAWKLDCIENWHELRSEGEVKTGSSLKEKMYE